MEPWAREWLEEQRKQGTKCLEIKVSGKNHYVYYSTTHWDKSLKKPVKTSEYLGKLDPMKGFIKSGARNWAQPIVKGGVKLSNYGGIKSST
jgi:hypothetical protein